MTTTTRWKRVGSKAGPGNRYTLRDGTGVEVYQSSADERWYALTVRGVIGNTAGYRTMREARAAVEELDR